MVFIGIDPGKNGGIAYISCPTKGVESATSLAYTDSLLLDVCEAQSTFKDVVCCLEQVHAFPGQSAQSQFNFGQSYGFIRGVLEANEISYQVISPMKWKKEFGLTSDKQLSIDVCRRLFPGVCLRATERCKKDHDGMAEALLMAEYAKRHFGG